MLPRIGHNTGQQKTRTKKTKTDWPGFSARETCGRWANQWDMNKGQLLHMLVSLRFYDKYRIVPASRHK